MTEVRIEGADSDEPEADGFEGPVLDPWPIATEVQALDEIDSRDVVNLDKLGELRFEGADQQLHEIRQILQALRLEDWDRLPTDVVSEIQGNVGGLLNTVGEMAALSPASDPGNYQNTRSDLQRRFSEHYLFFRNRVWPLCLTSRLSDVLRTRSDLWGGDLSPERLGQLQQEFDRLEATASELQRLAPLVEAQRELVGESGASKLSHDFDERAKEHANSFKRWAFALILTVIVGGVGAVLFAYLTRPPADASNSEIATYVVVDVLVLGLIVFLVRFVAVQTRAHRHMQFVARNKANALSTFNRIVSGQQDPDVRSNVAAALAQAVFKSDDGVFSDATGDTVTIIDRMGTALSRSSRPPT